MIPHATEVLSDAGDAVAGALQGMIALAQDQGVDCSDELNTLENWSAASTVFSLDTGRPIGGTVIHRDD